jgi:hypothetical protein
MESARATWLDLAITCLDPAARTENPRLASFLAVPSTMTQPGLSPTSAAAGYHHRNLIPVSSSAPGSRLEDLLGFVKAEFDAVSGEVNSLRGQNVEYEGMGESFCCPGPVLCPPPSSTDPSATHG